MALVLSSTCFTVILFSCFYDHLLFYCDEPVLCLLAHTHFLHFLCTSCDMKPENLMLSTEIAKEAIIQVVDFGCAQVELDDDEAFDITGRNEAYLARGNSAFKRQTSTNKPVASTPAYSPPEALDKHKKISTCHVDPSLDMWAMGVILYIMLTGVHPFDLYGNATEHEIEQLILSGKKPPLRNSPITAHLSQDAIALIEQLLQWEPKKRLTADQLLAHPWVRGETARTSKMADSDKRLAAFRTFKTRLEAKVFAGMVSWTDNDDSSTSDSEDDLANHGQGKYRATGSADNNEIVSKRTSLIERSFQMLDEDKDGYVTKQSLMKHLESDDDEKGGERSAASSSSPGDDDKDDLRLSLSGFSEFLSDHMQDKVRNAYYHNVQNLVSPKTKLILHRVFDFKQQYSTSQKDM
jgi:serine/threonine protein kinase